MNIGTASISPVTGWSRGTAVAYWAATGVIVTESLVGGAFDLFRLPPFFPLLAQLGYPAYLATILGIAKILAGGTLILPRLPRLKEWAYAGILINMLGAAASQVLAGKDLSGAVPPLAFAAIALVSWACRPAGRRLPDPVRGPVRTR